MTTIVEKKFAVLVVYNGITKPLEVQPEERVTAVLQRAIAMFGITQNPHLLSLYREDGSLVPENQSVEGADLKPDEVLLLRPNAVKGGAVLSVACGIVERTFDTLRKCGHGKYECAVYWTGPPSDDFVDNVEHPVHTQSSFGYEIDSDWLTQFWKRLARLGRSVKAQIHTHPGAAFHSSTDAICPIISQPGFVSIVIPAFARGAPSFESAWIGKLDAKGTWRHLATPADVLRLV